MIDHGWFITEPPPVCLAERSCAEHRGSLAGMARAARVRDGDATGVTVAAGDGLERASGLCAVEVVDGEVVAAADFGAGLWLHPASSATHNDADTHPSTQRRHPVLIVPPRESWSLHRATADHKPRGRHISLGRDRDTPICPTTHT
jgi:hypothetical protein